MVVGDQQGVSGLHLGWGEGEWIVGLWEADEKTGRCEGIAGQGWDGGPGPGGGDARTGSWRVSDAPLQTKSRGRDPCCALRERRNRALSVLKKS